MKINTTNMRQFLTRYETASGQLINAEKSSITFSSKAPATLKQAVNDDLRIQKKRRNHEIFRTTRAFQTRKRDLFAGIVNTIKQKASGWSNRFLSITGKLVMLKSVLSPIPSFAMSCFKLPFSLIKRIQSAVTRFMWDDRS